MSNFNYLGMQDAISIYKAFFGSYLRKDVLVFEDGYYCGDSYIAGRFRSGVLSEVRIERDHLVLVLDGVDFTVSFSTMIKIADRRG